MGWGSRVGKRVVNGDRVSVCGDELVPNVGSGDVCTRVYSCAHCHGALRVTMETGNSEMSASCCLVSRSCPTLFPTSCTVAPPGSSCPWDSAGKNPGEGCRFLLQGNLSDLGIEPESPAWWQILYLCITQEALSFIHSFIHSPGKPYSHSL